MFDTNWPYAYRSRECYECTYHGFDYSFDASGGFINNCFFCPCSNFPDNSVGGVQDSDIADTFDEDIDDYDDLYN